MERIEFGDIIYEKEIHKIPGVVEVHRARLRRSPNELICVKKVYVESAKDAGEKYNECLLMLGLNHPNIMKLRSCEFGGDGRNIDFVYIVMDFFPEGDFDNFIKGNQLIGYFSEDKILGYADQLIKALSYMQRQNISHRDIKPQNILVTNNGSVLKLCDLGAATQVDREAMTLKGTPLYTSPLVAQAYGKSFTTGIMEVVHNPYKSDVYSLGLVLLYAASFRDPKDLKNLSVLKESIKKRISEIRYGYYKTSVLIEKMLEVKEEDRMDFIELEAFFDNLMREEAPIACGRCRNFLPSDQVKEFMNSKYCSTCYSFVTNIYQNCPQCNRDWPAKDFYNHNNTQFCKFCVSKINFFEDKL